MIVSYVLVGRVANHGQEGVERKGTEDFSVVIQAAEALNSDMEKCVTAAVGPKQPAVRLRLRPR